MIAVVFDMDGVLFDTEARMVKASLEASDALRLGLTERVVLDTLGMTEALTEQRYRQANPRFDPAAFWPACYAAMDRLLETDGVPLKPYVRETLRTLRARGVAVGLCSATPEARVLQYLGRTGLRAMFDAVITGRPDVPGKPAPDMYLHAARALGAEPARCVAVEDAPKGLRAARRAGMVTCMVPDLIPYTDALAADCDHVLPSLKGLPGVVEGLSRCR